MALKKVAREGIAVQNFLMALGTGAVQKYWNQDMSALPAVIRSSSPDVAASPLRMHTCSGTLSSIYLFWTPAYSGSVSDDSPSTRSPDVAPSTHLSDVPTSTRPKGHTAVG